MARKRSYTFVSLCKSEFDLQKHAVKFKKKYICYKIIKICFNIFIITIESLINALK